MAPRSWAMECIYKGQARTSLWLLKVLAGIDLEVRGLAKLLPGPVIVASKHQSAWDTFGLTPFLNDPTVVMKAELFWIPFLGWFSFKYRLIGVDRSAGPAALRKLVRDAKDRLEEKREILLFPEGNRKAPGASPDYKSGIILLYQQLGVPVCPVALNSGLYWPRRTFLRYSGKIIVEFLDPIPPGLPKEEFKKKLQNAIEAKTAELIDEALSGSNPPPSLPKIPPQKK